LSFAPRFNGFKRVHTADDLVAQITAERLVEHLARISQTLADAGLVLGAPTGFRMLPMHPLGEYTRYWLRRENLLARQ
jgi:hypothetical protein